VFSFSSTHLCKLVAISGWWEEIFHHYSFGCDCLKLVGILLLILLQLVRNFFVVVVVASLRALLVSSSFLSFVSDGLISTLSLSLCLFGFFFCERLEEKVGEEKGFCHFFLGCLFVSAGSFTLLVCLLSCSSSGFFWNRSLAGLLFMVSFPLLKFDDYLAAACDESEVSTETRLDDVRLSVVWIYGVYLSFVSQTFLLLLFKHA
jgi:hypothetical protein